MTDIPEILPGPLVLFVVFDQVCMLDLSGPQTTFWAANQALRRRGLPVYERLTASLEGGLVQTAEGVPLQAVRLEDAGTIDTLVVPGSPHIDQVLERGGQLVEWLRGVQARRVASVCSGAFLLAEAGWLAGKRATTHWAMCGNLQRRFPSVEVEVDAIFIEQGQVWTSAGVTTGIDLCLALIESDHGHEVAMEVARELVVFFKRPGGQAQFSQLLEAQSAGEFESLHNWMAENLGLRLNVEDLAEKAGMSARHFARVYQQKTGRTPAKALELMRVEAARRLLESSACNIEETARRCGFGNEERLRVSFQRHLGVSPRDYRQRFATSLRRAPGNQDESN